MATVITEAPSRPLPDRPGADERALEIVLTTIDSFDAYTGGHPDRVTTYAGEIARIMGLSYRMVQLVKETAFVHDIGKIFIPEWIIQKPGKLTDEERQVIQMHATLGARMLSRRPAMRALAPIVRHHHERWDGKGYPDGLSGTEIPLASRIIFVADAFDAMTSDRPYGRIMSEKEASSELRRCAGADFDPIVVRAMRLALTSGAMRRAVQHRSEPARIAG